MADSKWAVAGAIGVALGTAAGMILLEIQGVHIETATTVGVATGCGAGTVILGALWIREKVRL